jgi:cell division protein FtsZ
MRVSVVATGIEAEQILQSSNGNKAETSVFAVEEVSEDTDHNLSFEEPIVAKTQAIFEEVDNEISASRGFDQSLVKENDGLVVNSQPEESLDFHSQSSSPGNPSADTLARLRAAVTKGTAEKNKLQSSVEQPETERPKFGISSLISRMSRSESSNAGSGVGRKEPNFNSEAAEERDFDDLEQDKIEVPAFLRRQAN